MELAVKLSGNKPETRSNFHFYGQYLVLRFLVILYRKYSFGDPSVKIKFTEFGALLVYVSFYILMPLICSKPKYFELINRETMSIF